MTEEGSDTREDRQFSLTLLATSDLHAAVVAYDYFSDGPGQGGSLARLAHLIEDVRAEGNACVLLDNGDFLQGTPMADAHVGLDEAALHPVIRVMNWLRYDAVALGNHEFNLERADLRRIFAQARFPRVCANLEPVAGHDGGYAGLWQSATILNVAVPEAETPLKLGVFGVLPPQVLLWDSLRIGDSLTVSDIVTAAEKATATLKADGADVVVALAHTGIAATRYESGMENAAVHVAALDDVDALVTGHIHKVFPGPDHPHHPAIDATTGTLHGKPAVMPGAMASHLGRIDLALEHNRAGWTVASHRASVIAAQDTPEHPDVLAMLAPAHARTLAATRATVGRLKQPVHSFFAMIHDDLSVRLVAEAKLAHVQREIAGTDLADMPVLASVAPMKCGGRSGAGHYTDIDAGPIAMRAVADLQYYANHLSVLKLSGAQVLDWLEMSASLYGQLALGQHDQTLFDRDTPAYNREAIYGLAYAVDLTQPARYDAQGRVQNAAARRITGVRFRRAPLNPEQAFLVASNEYRAGGGGHYPGAQADNQMAFAPVEVRHILAEHLRQTGGDTSKCIPSWRFCSIANTSATFDTGAAAVGRHAPEGLDVTHIGPAGAGFARFRLNLGG